MQFIIKLFCMKIKYFVSLILVLISYVCFGWSILFLGVILSIPYSFWVSNGKRFFMTMCTIMIGFVLFFSTKIPEDIDFNNQKNDVVILDKGIGYSFNLFDKLYSPEYFDVCHNKETKISYVDIYSPGDKETRKVITSASCKNSQEYNQISTIKLEILKFKVGLMVLLVFSAFFFLLDKRR